MVSGAGPLAPDFAQPGFYTVDSMSLRLTPPSDELGSLQVPILWGSPSQTLLGEGLSQP